MKNKTPIEKSHSKWSNTKLTLLCLTLIVISFLFWTSLIYYFIKENVFYLYINLVSLLCFIIGLILTSKFKR